jgi:hypothetical protein
MERMTYAEAREILLGWVRPKTSRKDRMDLLVILFGIPLLLILYALVAILALATIYIVLGGAR